MATQSTDSVILEDKLHEGYLLKKGKLNKSWKKRHFILGRDHKLKYYSTKPTAPSNKEIGFINLYSVTGISTHKFDNTNTVYDLNNPNIKKNISYYEEQNIYQSQKDKSKNRRNRSLTYGNGILSGSHSPQALEFIFKLYTPKRIWHLKCIDTPDLSVWTNKIKEIVYGNILYEGYVLIEEKKQWKSRWAVMTDKYQFRIYEDETQNKYKHCIQMEQLNMVLLSQSVNPKYFNNRREYPMVLSRSDKQFHIATLSHKSRQIWMDKFADLMSEELHKMEIVKEGYICRYEQGEQWSKKYCGIDSENFLYFADDFDEFRIFTKGIYFDMSVFEEQKSTELDSYLCLFENDNVFSFGRMSHKDILAMFKGTEQQNNRNIFYIRFEEKVFGNNDMIYMAVTSESELKSWLHSLGVIQKEYIKKYKAQMQKAMPSIKENDRYESKMEMGTDLWSINDENEEEHSYNIAMIESMPFYANSRISVSITQSCLDMSLDTRNMISMTDIIAQKEIVWSQTWKEMNNLYNNNNYALMDIQSQNECKSITECPCFQRLSFLLQFYDDWCQTKRKLLLECPKENNLGTHSKSPHTPVTPSMDASIISSSPSPRPHNIHTNNIKLLGAPSENNSSDEDMKQDSLHNHSYESNSDGIYDYLNAHFEGYSTLRLINDYWHIYLYHKYNENDFEFIYSHLPMTLNCDSANNKKCNVIMCDMLKRNERCRGSVKQSYFGYSDIKHIICVQILDRIHSVLYHSTDLFRLNASEKQIIAQKEKDSIGNESDLSHKQDISGSDDSNYELFMRSMSMDSTVTESDSNNKKMYIDRNFDKMHKIMRSKQTKLIQIRNQFNRNCNKFCTDIPFDEDMKSEDNEMHIKNPTFGNGNDAFPDIDTFGMNNRRLNKKNRSQSAQTLLPKPKMNKMPTLDSNIGCINVGRLSRDIGSANMNEFGIKFTYWKEDRKSKNESIYITAKYVNLKQEILSNKMYSISRKEWDQTFSTAQLFMQSIHCKDFIADLTESDVKKYGIKDGAGIAINHLQSLLLYCNFGDTLHKYLTFTYNEYDSDNYKTIFTYNQIIKRHSEFVNFSKYMAEFVICFGKNIYKSSQFYHAINKKYKFKDFKIVYNYPISVTKQLNIATQFVNKSGIIMALNRCEMMSGPKIINCAFFSDKEYEEEILIMFVNQRPLKITSIIELNTSYSYYYYICAIDVLRDIINGKQISNGKTQLKFKRLHQLLQYKFNVETYDMDVTLNSTPKNGYNNAWLSPHTPNSQRYFNFAHKMDYIHKLFIAYCNGQNNLIKLDVKLLTSNKLLNANVAPFFIDNIDSEDKEVNCVKMGNLIKLFPNCKAFEIKCPVLHSFTFDSIIQLLDEGLIQNMESQIQQITLKWVNWVQQKHCDIDSIIDKYCGEFEKYNWSITKKHKYGFDYIHIQRNL